MPKRRRSKGTILAELEAAYSTQPKSDSKTTQGSTATASAGTHDGTSLKPGEVRRACVSSSAIERISKLSSGDSKVDKPGTAPKRVPKTTPTSRRGYGTHTGASTSGAAAPSTLGKTDLYRSMVRQTPRTTPWMSGLECAPKGTTTILHDVLKGVLVDAGYKNSYSEAVSRLAKPVQLDNTRPVTSLGAKRERQFLRDVATRGRMSRAERSRRGFHKLSKASVSAQEAAEMCKSWHSYIESQITPVAALETFGAAIASADLHGAYLHVIESKVPGLIGASGVVVLESKHSFTVVSPTTGKQTTLLKSGTKFALRVRDRLVTLHGDTFRNDLS